MSTQANTTFTLNTGAKIPGLGLGTWQSKPHEVANAVRIALESGYKHIDGAAIYGNENEVGEGIKASGVKRESFWLTSKLWNNAHAPDAVSKALDQTLKDLETDYLDLYLIHWPVAFKTGDVKFPKNQDGKAILEDISIADTWKAMEKLVESGKVKNIGVSNFNVAEIEEVLKIARIKPSVHQIELHPYLAQRDFISWHKKHGIHVTAYSPFGNRNETYSQEGNLPQIVEHPEILRIAKKYGNKTGADVAIAWHLAHGVSAVPKSVNEQRIKSNLGGDFKLAAEDVKAIDALDQKKRYNNPSKSFGKTFYQGLDG